MEPPEPTSVKFKLWRWLLLLSVTTVTLGGFVWWKSRSERLQFVEPIWSDSLAGHENDSASTGQRRKIGEVWLIRRYSGLSLFSRGRSRDFEGRFPVFTESEALYGSLSKKLLAEMRGEEEFFIEFDPPNWNWWDSIKFRGSAWSKRNAIQVLFCTDQAVSLRESDLEFNESERYESLRGCSYVNRNGEWRQLHRDELFDGKNWVEIVSAFCVVDIKRQGVVDKDWTSFDYHNLSSLSLTPAGITFYPPNSTHDPHEVLIPFERLKEYLKPNGPHRLFQSKVSE